ncbi:MAG: sulfite exporter TauE/SafE family protein, partial [Betaproteobacteria bacterium]
MHELPFVFAGFFVGLVVGLTGVGGGSLMTPLLIFAFGVKPHLAIGTDLLFAAFTKMGGAIGLARSRAIDWRIVASMAAGSIPASLLTLWALKWLGPARPLVQQAMTMTLGAALLFTAVATLYKILRGQT